MLDPDNGAGSPSDPNLHNGKAKEPGNRVVIKTEIDGKKIRVFYYHLMRTHEDLLKIGDLVKKGDLIGHVGNTGYSIGSHLHFSVRKPPYDNINDHMDPYDLLK